MNTLLNKYTEFKWMYKVHIQLSTFVSLFCLNNQLLDAYFLIKRLIQNCMMNANCN